MGMLHRDTGSAYQGANEQARKWQQYCYCLSFY